MKQDVVYLGGYVDLGDGWGVAVVLEIPHLHYFGAAFQVVDVCLNSAAFFL